MNIHSRRRPLRRAVDSTAALAIAALLLPLVAWVYRDERREAGCAMSPEELAALSTAVQANTLTDRQRRAVADLVHLVGTLHRHGAHTDTRAAYAFHAVVDVFEQLTPCSPAPVADDAEVGSPEWHSLHHTGEGQHHECEYDVCVEWSARRALSSASREGYWDERRQAGAR